MRIFGWCSTGGHEGKKLEWQTPCPGKYERLVMPEPPKQRRTARKAQAPIKREWVHCECPCHTAESVVDSSSTTKRKRKK